MSISYTSSKNLYGELTLDKGTDNLSFGMGQVNISTKTRIGEADWPFLEKTRTASTVANQQFYELAADVEKIRTVTVNVGSTEYSVKQAPSPQYWDNLNFTTYTSDIPEFFYVLGSTMGLYPTPSSNGNTINYNYKRAIVDLDTEDYTTGTVAVTAGSTVVTGTATTFTAAMVGRYLKTSDGYWYEIGTFTSTTVIGLVKPYLGSTGSGLTFTIAQLSVMPDGYENMPIFDAASTYFTKQGNFQKAAAFKELADGLLKKMKGDVGAKTESVRIHMRPAGTVNPNLFLRY